jgi:hypothetical protein
MTDNQWYINTNAGSAIYTAINTFGVAELTERTEPSYVKELQIPEVWMKNFIKLEL